MSAVGSFADPSQPFLLDRVSGHGVFVLTCVSSVGAASRLEAGTEALLPLALAIPLALAFAFASFALAFPPFPPVFG